MHPTIPHFSIPVAYNGYEQRRDLCMCIQEYIKETKMIDTVKGLARVKRRRVNTTVSVIKITDGRFNCVNSQHNDYLV